MYLIKKITPGYIEGTPMAISMMSVRREQYHYHENVLELVYCIRGEVNLTFSYEKVILFPGQILCINPNEVHALDSDNNNLVVSFHIDLDVAMFEGRSLPGIMLATLYDLEQNAHNAYLKEKLNSFLLSVLYLYTGHYEINEAVFNRIAKELVDFIYKNFGVYSINSEPIDIPWSKERFENILLYINTHYKEKITLKQLSVMEHLNSNYLSIYFNKVFEDTFHNYLAVIRVYHSELELLTTRDNISTIAYNYGFSDPKFYYKAFKRWYGRTPNEHRKKVRDYNASGILSRVYTVNEIRHVIQQYILYHLSKLQLESFDIYIPDIKISSEKDRNFAEWRLF